MIISHYFRNILYLNIFFKYSKYTIFIFYYFELVHSTRHPRKRGCRCTGMQTKRNKTGTPKKQIGFMLLRGDRSLQAEA